MVKIRCRIRPMTASGDPWQLSHSLGVAVIGLGYLGVEPDAQFCQSEQCPGSVAIGAVVTRDVALGALVIGVPACYYPAEGSESPE